MLLSHLHLILSSQNFYLIFSPQDIITHILTVHEFSSHSYFSSRPFHYIISTHLIIQFLTFSSYIFLTFNQSILQAHSNHIFPHLLIAIRKQQQRRQHSSPSLPPAATTTAAAAETTTTIYQILLPNALMKSWLNYEIKRRNSKMRSTRHHEFCCPSCRHLLELFTYRPITAHLRLYFPGPSL